jgi:cytochrome c oxidase subunit 2
MQMKIIVDTPEDYKKWLSEQVKLSQQVKDAVTPAAVEGALDTAPTKAEDTVAVSKIAMK